MRLRPLGISFFPQVRPYKLFPQVPEPPGCCGKDAADSVCFLDQVRPVLNIASLPRSPARHCLVHDSSTRGGLPSPRPEPGLPSTLPTALVGWNQVALRSRHGDDTPFFHCRIPSGPWPEHKLEPRDPSHSTNPSLGAAPPSRTPLPSAVRSTRLLDKQCYTRNAVGTIDGFAPLTSALFLFMQNPNPNPDPPSSRKRPNRPTCLVSARPSCPAASTTTTCPKSLRPLPKGILPNSPQFPAPLLRMPVCCALPAREAAPMHPWIADAAPPSSTFGTRLQPQPVQVAD